MSETIQFSSGIPKWEPPTPDWPTNRPVRSEKFMEVVVNVEIESKTRNRGTFTYFIFTLSVQEVLSPHNHKKVTWDTLTQGYGEPLRVLQEVLAKKPFSLNPYSNPKDKFKVGHIHYTHTRLNDIGETFRESIQSFTRDLDALKGKILEV